MLHAIFGLSPSDDTLAVAPPSPLSTSSTFTFTGSTAGEDDDEQGGERFKRAARPNPVREQLARALRTADAAMLDREERLFHRRRALDRLSGRLHASDGDLDIEARYFVHRRVAEGLELPSPPASTVEFKSSERQQSPEGLKRATATGVAGEGTAGSARRRAAQGLVYITRSTRRRQVEAQSVGAANGTKPVRRTWLSCRWRSIVMPSGSLH
jgi:hypothetical protein